MKNKLKLILLICALFGTSYYFSSGIQNTFLSISDKILSNSYSGIDKIYNIFHKYFNQVEQIEKLNIKIKNLEKYQLLYNNLKNDYDYLLKANDLKPSNFNAKLVRILSYEQINNTTRFWIDLRNLEDNKAYGLVYDNTAVGIMYKHNNRAYALSINDKKCAFSVNIGENKIPAIIQGDKNKVYVNFIRDYEQVNVGDKVYTSGKDMIFTEGIYVGEISEIINEAGYKKAILKDTKNLRPYRYVYAIDIKSN